MNLSTLIQGIDIEQSSGADEARVCDVTDDSRTVVPGSLFIARSGTNESGSRYAIDAIGRGAGAVLTDDPALLDTINDGTPVLYTRDCANTGCVIAERFYGNPSDTVIVGAVTGTNGKSSVAYLVESAISHAKRRCGLISTVEIDDGRERSRAVLTTPPGTELSRTIATMREHGCDACVMEASSHALDQGRVGAINIKAAAFTNLSGDHLDYHGDLGAYTDAKAKLFSQLRSGSTAVVNVDDTVSEHMIRACREGVRIVRVSMKDPGADWRVEVLAQDARSMLLRVDAPEGSGEIRVPFFGAHNASNLIVAYALADAMLGELGVDQSERINALISAAPALRLPPGRTQRVDTDLDDIRVFVDFAHTDDALEHVLTSIRSVTHEHASLWCVFGCGGDRDITKRSRMGIVASEGADCLVVTSDNPRTEDPDAIIQMVVSEIASDACDRVEIDADRAGAIAYAISHAAPGDAVVIAGKGHETEQIVSDGSGGVRRTEFDDVVHARAALAQRRAQGVSV